MTQDQRIERLERVMLATLKLLCEEMQWTSEPKGLITMLKHLDGVHAEPGIPPKGGPF
jgi:hypothetical protein